MAASAYRSLRSLISSWVPVWKMRYSRSCLFRSRPGPVSAPGSRWISLLLNVHLLLFSVCSIIVLKIDTNALLIFRLLLPLVTTTVTWVWEWSAPKRWPLPFVEPSSWPNSQLSLSGGVIGVIRLASPTPYPARWRVVVALSWCVWSLPLVVLESCRLLCPRSCSWWLVSTTVTPLLGAALPPSATLVNVLNLISFEHACFFSSLCPTSPVVV